MRLYSSTRHPMSSLFSLQRELDRAWERPEAFECGLPGRSGYPPVDVYRDDEGWVAEIEVPGIDPKEVVLETQGQTLNVSGKRPAPRKEGISYHQRESWSGEFSRSLRFPKDADLSRATASHKNGVLTLRIPESEESRPRQIAVQES